MLKVKDIMTRSVITARGDTSVQKICEILTRNKLSGVPIVNEKKRLIGFVSERDIIASVNKKGFLCSKASELMTKKVFSVREEVSAEEVSGIFTEKPYKYVPVVKNNKIVGIISRKDVISRLLGQYY